LFAGKAAMPDSRGPRSTDRCGYDAGLAAAPEGTRRAFLKSSAGLVAGGAATAQAPPERVFAQGARAPAPDAELERLRRARRILLRGGIVLTLDRQIGDFARADVLIEDGRIREVRPDIALSDPAAAVLDASSCILIPGFVDTHSHSYEGLLRASLPAGTIFDPTYERDFANLTRAYQPADVYAGALLTALGMIAMGSTTVVDTSQISHTPSTAMRSWPRSRMLASGPCAPTRRERDRPRNIRKT
jgi:hypothetical protein